MAANIDLRERLLVQRLLACWRDLSPQGRLPAPHDIQPADLADLWPACFTLDLGGPKPIFSHVGDLHVAQNGRDLTGRPAEEAGGDTLLGGAVAYLDEVLSLKIPITYGGTFTDADGEPVAYRSILLPLSDDGHAIIGVLGGANCRFEEFK